MKRYPGLIRIHKQTAVNPLNVYQWELGNRHNGIVRLLVAGKKYPFVIARRRVQLMRDQLSELQNHGNTNNNSVSTLRHVDGDGAENQ